MFFNDISCIEYLNNRLTCRWLRCEKFRYVGNLIDMSSGRKKTRPITPIDSLTIIGEF